MFPKINISIKTRVQKLCSIQFRHNYYNDGLCRDFTIEPTQATKLLLSNYRLILKQSAFGFTILADKDKTFEYFKKYRKQIQGQKLSFVLKTKNVRFINFSNLPFLPSNTIHYFNNLQGTTNANKESLLHPTPLVEKNKDIQLPLVPPVFNYTFSEQLKYIDYDIKNIGNNKIEKPLPTAFNEQYTSKKQQVDLSYLPTGKYQIYTKKDKETFDFYTGTHEFNQCFGVVDIFIDDTVTKTHRLYNDKEITPQDYMIDFDARATYWRYYFINQQEVKYSNFELSNKEQNLQFLTPENIHLNNGKKAIRIASKEPIKLHEIPKYKMELRVKKNGKKTPKIIKLPTPSIDVVKPDLQNIDNVYSDVYIYL